MQDGTLKVTPIESKAPQVAARFTITATLDGFPFTVEAEGNADSLRALVARLKAIGATPPASANLPTQPTKQNGAPLCSTHNTAMKEGRRGWYCPKKVGDSYCKEIA